MNRSRLMLQILLPRSRLEVVRTLWLSVRHFAQRVADRQSPWCCWRGSLDANGCTFENFNGPAVHRGSSNWSSFRNSFFRTNAAFAILGSYYIVPSYPAVQRPDWMNPLDDLYLEGVSVRHANGGVSEEAARTSIVGSQIIASGGDRHSAGLCEAETGDFVAQRGTEPRVLGSVRG